MNSLNFVQIIGRLGKDVEIRYSSTGRTIANLTVATDESYQNKTTGQFEKKTEWHRIVTFGKVAENCSKFLKKGSLVYVEGSLQTSRYVDKQGNQQSYMQIQARRIMFLETKKTEANGNYAPDQNYGYEPARRSGNDYAMSNQERYSPNDPEEPFVAQNSYDDDMPF